MKGQVARDVRPVKAGYRQRVKKARHPKSPPPLSDTTKGYKSLRFCGLSPSSPATAAVPWSLTDVTGSPPVSGRMRDCMPVGPIWMSIRHSPPEQVVKLPWYTPATKLPSAEMTASSFSR